MRAVCAWCGKTLVNGDPADPMVSHGICPSCARRWLHAGVQYAVVPPERSFLLSEIQTAFEEVRDVQVILDRRRGERRLRAYRVRDDRRRPSRDRRIHPCPVVGALPTVAGLWLEGVRRIWLERSGSLHGRRYRSQLRLRPSRHLQRADPA
jgi:hypothetical protein